MGACLYCCLGKVAASADNPVSIHSGAASLASYGFDQNEVQKLKTITYATIGGTINFFFVEIYII